MKSEDDNLMCRTPNPEKAGTTKIPTWKFDAIRTAILAELAAVDHVRWTDLTAAVNARLSEPDRAKMGSVAWHTVSVKLEMEVRGEIARLPGSGPQVIKRQQ